MAEEDIIFGKHRHLFGGVEPSNMRKFSVNWDWEYENTVVTAELPKDTVIDGQTLCTVAGAVIRRKMNGYPKDEFDGELVKTIYESGSFIDPVPPSPDEGVIYYYAAFPFSTQGVYTRSEENYAIYNGISHFLNDLNKCVTIITDYEVKVYSNKLSSTNFDGFIICRSEDGYPKNEKEGIIVHHETLRDVLDFVDSVGECWTTYYYSIFFYKLNGDGSDVSDRVYDYNIANRFKALHRDWGYIFGFDLDTNDPNPNTRVTYPDDVDNTCFKPAKMDYDSGTFNYGDWPSEPGYGFMPRPVLLESDGTIKMELDPNDYALSSDGNFRSNITDTSGTANVMMQWGKIYTYREYNPDTGIYKFRCSDYYFGTEWLYYSNSDENGNEIDNFYTAVYPGCYTNNKLRSLSGQTVKTAISPSQAIDYANNNGDYWYIDTLVDRLLIQDLLILMAKTTDCQKAYGKGICGGSTAVTTTGNMDSYGLFWGSEDPTQGVKVFGMENWWGNHERYLAGAISIGGSVYVRTQRNYYHDYNLTGEKYSDMGTAMKTAGNIKEMSVHDFGRLPHSSGGSSSTYECDTARIDTGDTYYAMAGGNSKLGEHEVGPFQLRFMYTPTGTTTSTDRCATLSYRKDKR